LRLRKKPRSRRATSETPPIIEVPTQLDQPHRLVEKTIKALRNAHPDRRRLLALIHRHSLPIEVSRQTSDRALRIMDALIKAIEKRGHEFELTREPKRAMLVKIQDQTLRVSLRERVFRTEYAPRAEEVNREGLHGWSSAPRLDYEHSGRLMFRIHDLYGTGLQQTWGDGHSKRIEQCLGRIVVGLEAAARTMLERHLLWEHQSEEREVGWKSEEEVRRQKEHDVQLVEDLKQEAASWRAAEEVRAFVRAAQATTAVRVSSAQFEQWTAWANSVADDLDPLVSPPE